MKRWVQIVAVWLVAFPLVPLAAPVAQNEPQQERNEQCGSQRTIVSASSCASRHVGNIDNVRCSANPHYFIFHEDALWQWGHVVAANLIGSVQCGQARNSLSTWRFQMNLPMARPTTNPKNTPAITSPDIRRSLVRENLPPAMQANNIYPVPQAVKGVA